MPAPHRAHGQGGSILETQSPTDEGLPFIQHVFYSSEVGELKTEGSRTKTKVPFFLETFTVRKDRLQSLSSNEATQFFLSMTFSQLVRGPQYPHGD